MTARFAIYAAPGTGSADAAAVRLREQAESWLGRRMDGTRPDPRLPSGWTRAAVDEITVNARRYGFHGTLKAPFRLAEGRSVEQLEQDLERFARTVRPVALPQLRLHRMDGFFALVPGADAPELHELAAALVTGFDAYRAPATATEIARRNPDALTPRRRRMLEIWGYPYVLDEFRFHLTLTDRIPPDRHGQVHDALAVWFADCLGRTIAVDALTLCTQPTPGAPFRLHSVHPLRRPADRPRACAAAAHEGTR
ncbi:DUF1045 domain-containing protein [Pseudonocardia xinjiangensis]|uniref:DUF1045 domain-containing protein n=1 Tax=Pseudonocardia xinjiangensis TaxID=75289 RepID=UPI003D943030